MVLLGISQDEWHRARTGNALKYVRNGYPLLSTELTSAGLVGMLRPKGYSRQDCINVIQAAGLPVPPKSACWFCPFKRVTAWRQMLDEDPELFAKAVALEAHLNTIAAKRGDKVWLTDRLKPLPMVAGAASQPSLFGGDMADDGCESGYCMV